MAEIIDRKFTIEDENKIDTIMGEDIEFKGSLKFKNSLKIKCKFWGKIQTEGQLIIGHEANVNADINAKTISVSGNLKGKIRAGSKVELLKKSVTHADIISPDIAIESGSVFNGTCLTE